jgi:hypothetical protein
VAAYSKTSSPGIIIQQKPGFQTGYDQCEVQMNCFVLSGQENGGQEYGNRNYSAANLPAIVL